MRSIVFAKRTGKEILRDPLTFVFSLGFPILMLIIMTVIDRSLPPEAGMEIFHLPYLAPGITIFGLTFIMLFTCLQVSKDRSTAFLIRLYASPMKPGDFVAGYTLPLLGIALLQTIITFAAAFITAAITGDTLHLGNVALGIILSIPAALLFLSFGMLFGTILNEKAAPFLTSAKYCRFTTVSKPFDWPCWGISPKSEPLLPSPAFMPLSSIFWRCWLCATACNRMSNKNVSI